MRKPVSQSLKACTSSTVNEMNVPLFAGRTYFGIIESLETVVAERMTIGTHHNLFEHRMATNGTLNFLFQC